MYSLTRAHRGLVSLARDGRRAARRRPARRRAADRAGAAAARAARSALDDRVDARAGVVVGALGVARAASTYGVGDHLHRLAQVVEDDERVGDDEAQRRAGRGRRACARRQALERAHAVVAEPADRAAEEARQPRRAPAGRSSRSDSPSARGRIGRRAAPRRAAAPPPSTS